MEVFILEIGIDKKGIISAIQRGLSNDRRKYIIVIQ